MESLLLRQVVQSVAQGRARPSLSALYAWRYAVRGAGSAARLGDMADVVTTGAFARGGERDERLLDGVDDDGVGEMGGIGLASVIAGEAADSSLASASLDFLASPSIALSFGSRSGEGGAVEEGFVESAAPDASGEGMEVDSSRD